MTTATRTWSSVGGPHRAQQHLSEVWRCRDEGSTQRSLDGLDVDVAELLDDIRQSTGEGGGLKVITFTVSHDDELEIDSAARAVESRPEGRIRRGRALDQIAGAHGGVGDGPFACLVATSTVRALQLRRSQARRHGTRETRFRGSLSVVHSFPR